MRDARTDDLAPDADAWDLPDHLSLDDCLLETGEARRLRIPTPDQGEEP